MLLEWETDTSYERNIIIFISVPWLWSFSWEIRISTLFIRPVLSLYTRGFTQSEINGVLFLRLVSCIMLIDYEVNYLWYLHETYSISNYQPMKVDATYVASIPNSGVALSITHMVKEKSTNDNTSWPQQEGLYFLENKSTTFRSWLSSVPHKPLL